VSEVIPYDESYDVSKLRQVYHLRKAGKSFQEIAEEIGEDDPIALAKANKYFMTELQAAYGQDERHMNAMLELDRLDELQAAWWENAKYDKDSALVVLKIMQMRQKMLGLDLPDPTNGLVAQQVLVIGNDTKTWMEALQAGKEAGRLRDDGLEAEEES
jgi:hypothetical protein